MLPEAGVERGMVIASVNTFANKHASIDLLFATGACACVCQNVSKSFFLRCLAGVTRKPYVLLLYTEIMNAFGTYGHLNIKITSQETMLTTTC